jgi:Phage integrase family
VSQHDATLPRRCVLAPISASAKYAVGTGRAFISPDQQRERIEAWTTAFRHERGDVFEELDASGAKSADAAGRRDHPAGRVLRTRQSELRGPRWRAIGWTEGLIYVARKHTAAARVDGLPKGKKVYSVPMPDQLTTVLDQLSQRGHNTGDDDRVFVGNAKGGAVDRPALRRRWKAAQLRAGLKLDLRLHDLRHTSGASRRPTCPCLASSPCARSAAARALR